MSLSTENFGCKHYKRNVMLIAPCCCKTYQCRFCHDEAENHSLKREEVTVVQCAKCGVKQRKGKNCCVCNIQFGWYSCLQCALFDNVDKQQFHCDDCGICRIGGKDNYFHCIKCNMCLNKNIFSSHKCIENASRTDCPICLEFLHTSVNALKVLTCGHIMHEECYLKLVSHKTNSCPICQSKITEKLDYAGAF